MLKSKWESLLYVISRQKFNNYLIQQTLPRQLAKSKASSNFTRQNVQEDMTANMRQGQSERKEAKGEWDKMKEKIVSWRTELQKKKEAKKSREANWEVGEKWIR